jgi:hypothetical protein
MWPQLSCDAVRAHGGKTVRFIRVKTIGGEIHYVSQDMRKTNRETIGQQREADIHRDVRIALYKQRHAQGENIFTGDPLDDEEQKEEGGLVHG